MEDFKWTKTRRCIKNNIKKTIWILKGRPTLEADWKKISENFKQNLRKELNDR